MLLAPDTAIQVENLSKVFQFPAETGYANKAAAARFSGKITSELTALSHLSFSIKKGAIVGIIGENGAGKSTLLKILAGVLKPSSGRVIIRGKVASILDIGAGFHPDLTGRENIFMSGSLMEKTKKEVEQSLDEIITFSGLENFIDMPVKYYSNGMFMRLAFSTATHLDADVVLLDEVYSVGDQSFRDKCSERLRQMVHSNKTVLLVSHELQAVRSVCTSCLLLHAGTILDYGTTQAMVEKYIESALQGQPSQTEATVEEKNTQPRIIDARNTRQNHAIWKDNFPGNEVIQLKSVHITAANGNDEIRMTDAIRLEVTYRKLQPVFTRISMHINLGSDQPVIGLSPFRALPDGNSKDDTEPGEYTLQTEIPALLLNNGIYTFDVLAISKEHTLLFHLPAVCYFKVGLHLQPDDTSLYDGNFPGPLMPVFRWSLTRKD